MNSEDNKESCKGEEEVKKKIIASPTMISKLSPMASLARKEGVNFNPPSQGKLLQYYANKPKEEETKEEASSAQLDDKGIPS